MKSEEFARRIDDEKVEGWNVLKDGDERVVMSKPNYGRAVPHIVLLILTGWWTFGLVNLAYLLYCLWVRTPKKVVRDEGVDE